MNGTIKVHEDGTVTIVMENGAHGINLYPKGIKTFLEIEIEQMKERRNEK